MRYNNGSPWDASGDDRCSDAPLKDSIGAPQASDATEPEPRICAMANRDQKSRTANNKPKLTVKEKKERKERKAAAKQRDR
jgi:hypothetical protein